MKDWKRTLAALLAAIMLMMPFTATAELALEPDVLPEVDGGVGLEIAPESVVDAPDVELPDASIPDGLAIEGIDLDTGTIADAVIDGAEAEAGDPVLSNDDDYDDDDFDIDENGVLVKYRGNGGHVVIPDGVTSIGEFAFSECDDLTGVTIPASVTSIGEYAFYGCDRLTSVTIPASVTSIEKEAFAWCTSLTGVTIPASVTSIGDCAFYHCDSLTSVTIPASVTSIGEAAFSDCDSLKAINVSGKNPSYTSRDGVLYTRDMKTLLQCPGAKTTVNIPYGVTSIGNWAFASCDSLTGVTSPASVTSIGKYAFAWCTSLTGVTIPASVTSIGEDAFCDCNSLTSVTIPASVTSIGEEAFCDCNSLTSVTILSKSIDISKYGFKYSDPTFHIVVGSDAIGWADDNDYDYDTFTEGLSKKSLTLSVGQTHKLTVRVQGKLTTDVTWSSSNAAVATVKDGTVTAIREGSCTITATPSNGKALKCALTVNDPAKLSKAELSMNAGSTYTLKVNNLGNRTVTWSSSNAAVATVKNGTVTAIKAGTCTITATLSNGKALKCALTVKDAASLSETKLSLNVGKSYTLKINNLGNRTVTWSSSNKNVATVQDGTVTATGGGKCTITAKVEDGKTLECAVSVTDRAELYRYDSESEDYDWYYDYSSKSEYYEKECTPIKSASLDIGETLRLVVIYTAGRTVVWSSSNTKVATVNNGKVTPTGGGKCTITAKVGSKSLTCNLTVTDSAKLSETNLSMNIGDTHKLAIDKLAGRTVTWSSSNKKVATVKKGVITARKAGKCTITARVKNGKTFKCNVTVRDAAKLDRTKLSIKAGDSQTLEISGLNNRRVTWSSSNKKVATVKDGKITAVNIGRCIITAQIKNGKKLTCKVTVTDPAALSEDKLTISSVDSARIKLTDALKRKVTWSTSNSGVVKITNSNNGAASIKAVKNGTATVTAKIAGGKTLKCVVKVVDPLTIELDEIDEESIYNRVWVYFNNHSNKKITYVTLDIAQYNNRSDKLESPYSYFYLNETVAPHDSLHHYYWVNDDTKKVRITITEVTFADKTTWRP